MIIKRLIPQKSEEFLKGKKSISKNKYLASLCNLELIIIIHEIHSRVKY